MASHLCRVSSALPDDAAGNRSWTRQPEPRTCLAQEGWRPLPGDRSSLGTTEQRISASGPGWRPMGDRGNDHNLGPASRLAVLPSNTGSSFPMAALGHWASVYLLVASQATVAARSSAMEAFVASRSSPLRRRSTNRHPGLNDGGLSYGEGRVGRGISAETRHDHGIGCGSSGKAFRESSAGARFATYPRVGARSWHGNLVQSSSPNDGICQARLRECMSAGSIRTSSSWRRRAEGTPKLRAKAAYAPPFLCCVISDDIIP